MLLRPFLMVAAITFSLNLFAEDYYRPEIFKVAPYTLKHTNGMLLLNFQMKEDRKLLISDDQVLIPTKVYKKEEHYQIQLAANSCGTTKDLRITEEATGEVIYANNFPTPQCSSLPGDEEYTFGFISDTQQFTERHELISKVIAYHHARDPLMFLINGGDVVQNGSYEQEWIEYFKGGDAYIRDIPQIAAIGNHDYKKSKQEALPKYFQKYLRWEGASEDGNLFFEMPGFQLIIWNSNTPELTRKEEKRMRAWLESKMLKAQKSKTPLILATHFPVYSSSLNRFTSFPVMKLRKYMDILAEVYGVKLILSGHTHMYERSFKDGVNYLVAGPAGGRANKPTFKNPYMQKFDASALTFTKIRYKKKSFRIETYNQDNVLIDQLVINY